MNIKGLVYICILLQVSETQMNVCEYQSLLRNVSVGNMCQADRVSSMYDLNLGVDLTGLANETGRCSCRGEISYMPDVRFNMTVNVKTFYSIAKRQAPTCANAMKIITENRSYRFSCGVPDLQFFQTSEKSFEIVYEKHSLEDLSYLWCMTFKPDDPGVDTTYKPLIRFKCDPFIKDVMSTTSSAPSTSSAIFTSDTTVKTSSTTKTTLTEALCNDEIQLSVIIPVIVLAVVLLLTVIIHLCLYRRSHRRSNKPVIPSDPQQTCVISCSQEMTPVRESGLYSNENAIGTYTSIRRDDIGLGTYDSIRYDVVRDQRPLPSEKKKLPPIPNGNQHAPPVTNGSVDRGNSTSRPNIYTESTRRKQVYQTGSDNGYLSPATSDSTALKQAESEGVNVEVIANDHVTLQSEDNSSYIHPEGSVS